MKKKIASALISVFNKERLEPILKLLNDQGVHILSTGGTQKYIESLNIPVTSVESETDYPSILGGRVKTLHPKIFGGILQRSNETEDQKEVQEYNITSVDLVIVDLYPFEETVASGADENAIIEKIDIGGIALIRAAAKNFRDVLVVSSRNQYDELLTLLENKSGSSDLEDRKFFAKKAFDTSSHYDALIYNYFLDQEKDGRGSLKISEQNFKSLRYGENPHQAGIYYGKLEEMFSQLHGKELSYNNLVDIDAAVNLIEEFGSEEITFAILKHTNACGVAVAQSLKEAYLKALEADNISAFGGVLITNQEVDAPAATEINKLFFEILVAPSFSEDAMNILKEKKNRILLQQRQPVKNSKQYKSLLNGIIAQDRDSKTDRKEGLDQVTQKGPSEEEIEALLFGSKVCKHTKSNAIVLAKKGQLLASGVGQTSRVDALKQAIAKAKYFGFNLKGAIMASDAFFPFSDSVEIACNEGISAVIQPGGSKKDQDSIDYCDKNGMSMVFTGTRHFKH